jgi:hypothetical protein
LAQVNHEQTALNLIDALSAGLGKAEQGLNADQTIEVVKAYAMLAQARSQERIADAIWSVSTSLDEIAKNMPNE